MEWGRKHRWALMPCGLYQMKLVFKNCQVSALLRGLSVRLKCSSFPSRNLSALYSDIKKLSEGLAWSWKRRKCLLPWDSRRSLETGAREVRRSLGKDAAVSLHLLRARAVWRLAWLRVLEMLWGSCRSLVHLFAAVFWWKNPSHEETLNNYNITVHSRYRSWKNSYGCSTEAARMSFRSFRWSQRL